MLNDFLVDNLQIHKLTITNIGDNIVYIHKIALINGKV